MSYCRWSSDDFACDVYVWDDIAGGWRTEVAHRRPLIDRTTLPPVPDPTPDNVDVWVEAYLARHNEVSHRLNALTDDDWLVLPEPDGGRSYLHTTPGGCADNLQRLAGLGFNVPPEAIAALRDEQTDLDQANA